MMTESQILVNCDEKSELACGSHLVNSIDLEVAPSVVDTGTMDVSSANAKVLTSAISTRLRIRDKEPNSGSKISGDTPRSTRKRRREGYKPRPPPSGDDDSESGEQVNHPSGSAPSSSERIKGRKKRQRRRKNRKYKPYSKLSWPERREQEARETRRANNVRAQRFANGQPVAPYNTTQFLMEDHGDLKDIDVKQAGQAGVPQNNLAVCPKVRQRGQRARDSSFSLDSEEDFYYSSPEDEKEFLTKEFSNEYEDLHAEQLTGLPKARLVHDILTLEKKREDLEKELAEVKALFNRRSTNTSDEDENTDEKVVLYKSEICKLSAENNRLRAENECLRKRCCGEEAVDQGSISSSSMDSESDSTSSPSGSCSSSSCSRAGEGLPQYPELPLKPDSPSDVRESPPPDPMPCPTEAAEPTPMCSE